MVLLKANVTSPEVELSHEELDFDSVLVGQSKTRFIQVRKTSTANNEPTYLVYNIERHYANHILTYGPLFEHHPPLALLYGD